MNVLLVLLHADPARGGAESYTFTLMRKLTAIGMNVSIAAATFADRIEPANRVPLRADGRTRSGRYNNFCRSLAVHLKQAKYDVVHAMLPVPGCDIYHAHAGVELLSTHGSPLLAITNHRRHLFRRVERDLFRRQPPVEILLLTERERVKLLHHVSLGDRRVHVLHSVPDDAPFRRDGDTDARHDREPILERTLVKLGGPNAIFIGQDFDRKGLDVALSAIANLPDVTLTVVGRDRPEPFRQQIARLNLEGRVKFVGHCDDIPAVLRRADVLLLPSRFDPFGMVAVEAMLAGVPPIVSRVAGVSELIRSGIDGLVIDGFSKEDWSDGVQRVLANRERMSAACLARLDEIAYDNHLRKLIAIYDSVVARRTSGQC